MGCSISVAKAIRVAGTATAIVIIKPTIPRKVIIIISVLRPIRKWLKILSDELGQAD